jgi:hypothetical protein
MHRNWLALAVALAVLPGCAQQIPRVDVTTLSGGHVVLPEPGSTRPLVIVIAFSAKGGNDAGLWNKRLQPLYTKDSSFEYLELADFQGVPSLIMKMILHGMRRSVHEPERSHLAPFYAAEGDWKSLVGKGNSNVDKRIAYVLVADASGHVRFQTHGPASDAKVAEVRTAITRLKHRPAS